MLEALNGGVGEARLALARNLAGLIDSENVPAYAKAQVARVLADVLGELEPDEEPAGIDVRSLLGEVVGSARRN